MSKACRVCHRIVPKTANMCPDCKTQDLSTDYTGEVIILDPENSEIAKRIKITKKGRYALRVR